MNRTCSLGAMMLLLLAGWPAGWAQQGSGSQPVGPYPPLSQSQQESSSQPQPGSDVITLPDTRPLSGAEDLSLGSSEASLNFLQPSLRVSQIVDSNPTYAVGSGDFQGVAAVSGGLELHRSTQRQQLLLSYTGAGVFGETTSLTSNSHQFRIAESFILRRWTFLLTDQVGYAPNSFFNGSYAGVPGLGSAGVLPGNLNPGFRPEQSVLTIDTARVINTAVGQVQYDFSPRSSLTVNGSYGIIRFPDFELDNVNQLYTTIGYNHAFSARDTVALSYGYGRFRFEAQDQVFQTHAVVLNYAHRLTGRVTVSLSGGPQLVLFDQGPEDTRVSWNAQGGMQYQRQRTGLSLFYSHRVTGGSGVLIGARTDSVQAAVSRQVARTWHVRTDFGYARNAGLTSSNVFNTLYGGVDIAHELSRSMGISLNYRVQHQISNAVCGLLGCPELTRHVISLAFNWTMRPIPLR